MEQKNWTDVGKLVRWERYDTPAQLHAIKALYTRPWRATKNLYQPCEKPKEKVRVGAPITRRYHQAQRPPDRPVAFHTNQALPKALRTLLDKRKHTDPFTLSENIDKAAGALTRKTGQDRKTKRHRTSTENPPPPRGRGTQPKQAQTPLHG